MEPLVGCYRSFTIQVFAGPDCADFLL